MLSYREDLDKACINKEPRIVRNKGAHHANQFMQVLLLNAKETVKIYTQKLDKQVSSLPGFKEAFESVLQDPNIEVKIIMEENTDNSEIETVIESYSKPEYDNTIKIGLSKELKDCILDAFNGNDYHYTVVDRASYRIEEDIIGFKAYGSFYFEKDFAKGLDSYFDFCINKF